VKFLRIESMSDGSLLLLDGTYWLVSAIWEVFIILEFKSCSSLLLWSSCHLLQCINSCELTMKGRRKTSWTHPAVLCAHQLTIQSPRSTPTCQKQKAKAEGIPRTNTQNRVHRTQTRPVPSPYWQHGISLQSQERSCFSGRDR